MAYAARTNVRATGVADPDGSPEMDYGEHERTYRRFVGLVKFAIVAAPFLIALILYWTI